MKTVIITGATRGLGFAIAEECVADGYRVIGIGRHESHALCDLMNRFPEHVRFVPFDLSRLSEIHDLAANIVKECGRPWGLINNAAVGHDGILATQHEREIGELIRINIEAPILLTKYLLRPMLIQRCGRVINISSIIATTGFNGLAVYAATKAALGGFTRSLAREVGKAGITVNTVAPGYMETDMTASLQGEQLEAVLRRSPLRRLVSPADVAYAVRYLLSDRAAGVTGTTMTVDAGSTA